jgi:hypothetical protein
MAVEAAGAAVEAAVGTALAAVGPPDGETSTGDDGAALHPQQLTLPSGRRTQVYMKPAATAVASVIPDTDTGVWLADVVPSPSWPPALSPQQTTPPPERRAQL